MDRINITTIGIDNESGLTFDQEEGVKLALKLKAAGKNMLMITGRAGCVDKNTEFLTPTGWKYISDYAKGDLVCQWYPDGNCNFTVPEQYIVEPADYLNALKNNTLDLRFSDGHRMPYLSSKGNHNVKSFAELCKLSSFTLPRSFKAPSGLGTGITNELLRVLIMQAADGSIVDLSSGRLIFINVKKKRKQTRVRELLQAAGISYTENKSATGYIKFRYYPPQEIATKSLSLLWECSSEEMEIVYDELFNWDGSVGKRTNVTSKRFTGNKEDCDVYQYICSSVTGNYCTVKEDKREYAKCKLYNLLVSSRSTSIVDTYKLEIKKEKTEDGKQYCFKTPSSFWLARRNGVIFPTGNTGKSYAVHKIIEALVVPEDQVEWTATTHKACFSLESQADDAPSVGTIQSLLKMRVTNDQECRSLAPAGQVNVDHLQVVVIDEVSYLPDGLVSRIQKVAEIHPQVFWIFMGDFMQINPVRHDISPIFKVVPEEQTIKFVTSVRQRSGSAVLSTVQEIREAIAEGYSGRVEFETGYAENGSIIVLSGVSFYNKFIETCLADEETRGIAWTNSAVDRMNNMVREAQFGTAAVNSQPFMEGEDVIAGSTLKDSENDLVIANNRREGKVLALDPVDYIPAIETKYGVTVSGYLITIDFSIIGQVYYPDREGWNEFMNKRKELYNKAKSTQSSYHWRLYHEFGELIGDLRYHWALTSHTSQGSTLGNSVFIDADNINECRKPAEKLRLFNVALSRGIKDVYIKQKR